MKHFLTLSLSTAAFALFVHRAHAQTVTPLLSQTVGTGSNLSYLVVDFQDGTTDHNYAFGYRYDGVKTGADLLSALAANTNPTLTVNATQFPFGLFVSGFGYNGHARDAVGNAFWAYYLSNDGANWTESGVGANDRILTNGSYDGWSYDADFTNPAASLAPVTPQAVPEPGGFVALLVAVPTVSLSLLNARRRRSK